MTMAHPYFDLEQTSTFLDLAPRKDSSFEVHYFGLHGFAYEIRTILAISGAKFENVFPVDWIADKAKTPFGVLPILKEIGYNGKAIQVAENHTICRYLSRKFNLLGTNLFEETLIDSFFTSTQTSFVNVCKIYDPMSPEAKADLKISLFEKTVQPWIEHHERHLVGNGTNGHYVGNKLSLADIKTVTMILTVNGLWGADTITADKSPGLIKVKTTLEAIPAYAAWTQTEIFKTLSAANKLRSGF
ncbi:Glutathione S-transferase S1 [Podila humilis]|nr:Glutathione S-transferase S1 [Podila humilis]